ncbi:MAG TPA: LysR family transcriptional regulator [Bradyrhizobium sp.]|nr:LysR family transcriptional regulator [Bradyrhizobium sp.]
MDDMDIESLRIFVRVARRGSFAVVARDCGTDPSSVSRTIAALEDELQVRLLQRSTRRMALTEAGAQYLARVEPLLEELDSAKDDALVTGAKPIGTIRLTASVAFGQKCIAPLLPKLRETFPDLGIDLLLTDANVDLVSEGIDLAVRHGPSRDSALIGVKLTGTKYRVCASPAYLEDSRKLKRRLKAPADLAAHRCLLLNLPDHRSRWLFRDSGGTIIEVPVDGDVRISSPLVLLTCAIEGMGPALLADWLAKNEFDKGALVDLFPDHAVTATDFETAAWLLYPSRSYLPRKVRVVIDFLRQEFGQGAS